MCVGDSNNDLPMLRYAGMGVAMGNASDRIKEQADYVTDSNDDDGIVKVIEKFMEQQPQLNDHNKQEYPPMHIVEMNTSLINQL